MIQPIGQFRRRGAVEWTEIAIGQNAAQQQRILEFLGPAHCQREVAACLSNKNAADENDGRYTGYRLSATKIVM